MPSVDVLIIAGGEATRLPGKLALDAGGLPLLARVFRNLSPGHETWLATNGSLGAELDTFLPAPIIVDRWSKRGPLAAMLTALPHMRSRWVFAVAGDAPFVNASVLDRLLERQRPGDEAVVPVHVTGAVRRIEPLAALYDKLAFLREGFALMRAGKRSLHGILEHLRLNLVSFDDAWVFANVNTPADFAKAERSLHSRPDDAT